MAKDLKPFNRGFRNTDYTELIDFGDPELGENSNKEFSGDVADGDERAVVNWATNSLRLKVPADKQREMTVAAAFISREEFLHGKWAVAIINTLGHLSLAASDALFQIVSSTDSDVETGDYWQVIVACEHATDAIFTPLAPFVEAVDKFQLLTVIDEGFVNGVESTYEEAQDGEADGEFRNYFYRVLNAEKEIAMGAQVPPGEEIYVNPHYFHALADIVVTWESIGEDNLDSPGDVSHAQARAIAEAVARATIDVPQPIKPLGNKQFSWFEPLSTDEIDCQPINHKELKNQYPISRKKFNKYLGKYPKKTNDEIGSKNTTNDRGFEYTYREAKESWVARAFINARKALADLRVNKGAEIAEDPEKLREILVERVHGEKPSDITTMLDHPTSLIDIPSNQKTPLQDEDVMSVKGTPLSKILLESFEHHGSFGCVVYDIKEDTTKYELNWHVRDENIDSEDYHHIPKLEDLPIGIQSDTEKIRYQDLWRHYYHWEGVKTHLLKSYAEYRKELISELIVEFDTAESLEQEIDKTKGEIQTATNFTSHHTYGMPNKQSSVSSRINQIRESADKMGKLARSEEIEEAKTEGQIRDLLSEYPTAILKRIAENHGCHPEMKSVVKRIQCPLCNVQSGLCGSREDCAYTDLHSTLENTLLKYIIKLANAELGYLLRK